MALHGDKSVGLVDHATGGSILSQEVQSGLTRDSLKGFAYAQVIDDICDLNWASLTQGDLINVAWVYYYFSVQFREGLEIARNLYPDDDRLRQLDHGERDTDNLSPWPGVAAIGERMNHDEFMRRTLKLTTIFERRRRDLVAMGQSYLTETRAMDGNTRALALASYEDGGLERVFGAILKAQHWNDPLLLAFKHFLAEHIRFDSDPEQGHGALCRHLTPDDGVLPLWAEFRQMLVKAAPRLVYSRRASAGANFG
jgi:hypothetical protein